LAQGRTEDDAVAHTRGCVSLTAWCISDRHVCSSHASRTSREKRTLRAGCRVHGLKRGKRARCDCLRAGLAGQSAVRSGAQGGSRDGELYVALTSADTLQLGQRTSRFLSFSRVCTAARGVVGFFAGCLRDGMGLLHDMRSAVNNHCRQGHRQREYELTGVVLVRPAAKAGTSAHSFCA